MKKSFFMIALSLTCGLLYSAVPGDINGNGIVHLDDLEILTDQWLDVPGSPSADIAPPFPENDEFVDFLDYSVIASHWLMTAPDANEMAFINGGEFEMGNHFPQSDPNNANELPVHMVKIDSFYMGKYEVTNGQYAEFLNAAMDRNSIYISDNTVFGITGSDPNQPYSTLANSLIEYSDGQFTVITKGDRDMSNDPMIYVSWYGAAAYCNWRSEIEGYQPCYNLETWECDFSKKGYRLPTEGQWEYAARGGENAPYYRFAWGDLIDHDHANYYQRPNDPFIYDLATSQYHPDWNDGIFPYTSPVDSFATNGFGLHNTVGNVWEWCNDWYDKDYYSISPYNNPTGPTAGIGRILRGGSWYTNAGGCRSANRNLKSPADLKHDYGFRLCLELN